MDQSPEKSDGDEGVDLNLIRWMLGLSPSERLDVLQGFIDSIAELRSDQDDSKAKSPTSSRSSPRRRVRT